MIPTKTLSGLLLVALASQAQAAAFTVTSGDDAVDSNLGDNACSTGLTNNPCTLRAAIQQINQLGGGTITIASTVTTITLTITGTGEQLAAKGDLDINSGITITGNGASVTTIDGNFLDRVFHLGNVPGIYDLRLEDLKIVNGRATGTDRGGAIAVARDTTKLKLTRVDLSQNESANGGGAVSNEMGAGMTIQASDLENNRDTSGSCQGGGAIWNRGGIVNLLGTEFTGNWSVCGDGGAVKSLKYCPGNCILPVVTIARDAWGNYPQFVGDTAINGGALANEEGTLSVTNAIFEQCQNPYGMAGYGGAIYNHLGTATVTDTYIHNVLAYYGGAIADVGGTFTADGLSVWDAGGYLGGAIYLATTPGSFTITDSSLYDNVATYGGAIAAYRPITVTDTTFTNNVARLMGGAIYAEEGYFPQTVNLTRCVLEDNHLDHPTGVPLGGGAIALDLGANAWITDSILDHNHADQGARGGAVYVKQGDMLIRRTAIFANTATVYGGGLSITSSASDVTIINTTFSANTAQGGGGIHSTGGTLALGNVTLTLNAATAGNGGGLRLAGSSVSIANSILGGNSATGSGADCSGALSASYTLFGATAGCTITYVAGNLPNVLPRLQSLQFIGGTWVHPPQLTSQALDAGDPATTWPQDQRNITRPGPKFDMGAFEHP